MMDIRQFSGHIFHGNHGMASLVEFKSGAERDRPSNLLNAMYDLISQLTFHIFLNRCKILSFCIAKQNSRYAALLYFFRYELHIYCVEREGKILLISRLLVGRISNYNRTMSMDNLNRELKAVIALIDSAIRKIKLPPEELKRAKSKLAELLKKRGSSE
jgi:hypothetical protein